MLVHALHVLGRQDHLVAGLLAPAGLRHADRARGCLHHDLLGAAPLHLRHLDVRATLYLPIQSPRWPVGQPRRTGQRGELKHRHTGRPRRAVVEGVHVDDHRVAGPPRRALLGVDRAMDSRGHAGGVVQYLDLVRLPEADEGGAGPRRVGLAVLEGCQGEDRARVPAGVVQDDQAPRLQAGREVHARGQELPRHSQLLPLQPYRAL
mmetsp:Transcript_21039/g.59747  ORF Transcript_21039/g.59747 Transcript_21039/m.59747 type:complete len:206 (-) Transcript_21039:798-1415(-)